MNPIFRTTRKLATAAVAVVAGATDRGMILVETMAAGRVVMAGLAAAVLVTAAAGAVVADVGGDKSSQVWTHPFYQVKEKISYE